MTDFLPKDIADELHAARRNSEARKSRLRVEANGESHRLFRLTPTGFAVENDTPRLRGLVDLYDGSRHLSQCLIVAASETDDGMIAYDFKRNTTATDGAPLDFERALNAPIALLGR